jgi:AraC-like DNA-binding protein
MLLCEPQTMTATTSPVRGPFTLEVDVPRAGVSVVHDQHFCINRPQGSGDFLFLHFLTPIQIRSVAGLSEAPAGSCMLYAPGFHQWYRGVNAGFRHHWCHFGGESAVAMVERFRIPVNTILDLGGLDFIPALISDMRRERLSSDPFASAARALLVGELLVNLSRRCQQPNSILLSPQQSETRDKFVALRQRMHNDLQRRWSVNEMATQVHLSESRFATLFTNFFSVSPTEDLIRARIDKARLLLNNTTLAVKQVAAQSGFTNLHYFSRLFHRRVGCAPREYQRRGVITMSGEPSKFIA